MYNINVNNTIMPKDYLKGKGSSSSFSDQFMSKSPLRANAFIGAKVAAEKAGKSTFTVGDKTFPVQMKDPMITSNTMGNPTSNMPIAPAPRYTNSALKALRSYAEAKQAAADAGENLESLIAERNRVKAADPSGYKTNPEYAAAQDKINTAYGSTVMRGETTTKKVPVIGREREKTTTERGKVVKVKDRGGRTVKKKVVLDGEKTTTKFDKEGDVKSTRTRKVGETAKKMVDSLSY